MGKRGIIPLTVGVHHMTPTNGRNRKGGREAYGVALEKRRGASLRGFESYPFRQHYGDVMKLVNIADSKFAASACRFESDRPYQ